MIDPWLVKRLVSKQVPVLMEPIMLTVFSLTKKFHSTPLLNPSFTAFRVELSNFTEQLLSKLFDKSPYSVQKGAGV